MPYSFGKVSYINSIPLFLSRDVARFDIQNAYPALLNSAVRKGELDLSLMSAWEYLDPKISDVYKVIPNFCIAGDGEIMSVAIFSKYPLYDLQKAKIFITNETGTSSRAFRFLIKRKFGFDIFSLERASSIECADAVLLIGNSALAFDGDMPYKFDLGELWKEQIGAKMLYAFTVAKRDKFDDILPLVTDYFNSSLKIFEQDNTIATIRAREELNNLQISNITDTTLARYYTRLIYKMPTEEFNNSLKFISENGEF